MSLNKNMRVVIVDDYTTMLRILRNLLRQLEINNVDEANDGDTAYHLMQKNPPDLVISDLRLREGESGLDVLAALDHHYGHDTPTAFARLLITGETRSDRLREIMAAKIPVLYKPVSPEQLREAMAMSRAQSHLTA